MNEPTGVEAIPRGGAMPVAEVAVTACFAMSRSASRWQSVSWRLESVRQDEAGGLRLALFRDEAEGYYLNVTTPEPSIFVQWRSPETAVAEAPPEAVAATLSYNEAARWMDAGEQVDRVPMPAVMVAWLTQFVNFHYRPEPGGKRRGQKASFMAREDLARLIDDERQRFGGGSR